MASAFSHHLLLVHSVHDYHQSSSYTTIPHSRCPTLRYTTNSIQLRAIRKSSRKNSVTTSPQEPKPLPGKPDKDPDPQSPSGSPFSTPLSLLRRLRRGFKVDELGLEILSVALPAALALAADPITSLVDTAFVGHLGSVELAAIGVSVSVFNLVSKLFNVPLLNITASFVAEEQALISKDDNDSTIGQDCVDVRQGKKLLPSVSTSLALAAAVGIVEAVVLFFGAGFLINIMGIPVDSPMHIPAEHFLSLRAFGAPPIVIALAAQGTFRGFMDTKTPLYAIGAGNFLNAVLDLILIFVFGIGISGAAIATVISEYLIAFILLWELNGKVLLISPEIDGQRVARYLKSGGLLTGRTLAVLVTMTLATSMAARKGPILMAGHQICLQVWLAVSLLTDALALSGQVLLASGYSLGNYEQARQVIYRVLQIGLVTGIALGVILLFGFRAFSRLLSTDSEVLEIAWSGIWLLIGLISSVFLLLAGPVFGLPGVWTGLFLFMALRVAAGIWR